MRTILLATILLATAFSGCLAEPATEQSVSASDSSSPTASSTATTSAAATTNATTTTAAANTAPTANITSDVPNGTAPLNVTFTIEGSDDDGDSLNWTLDVDADGTAEYNGTSLPDAVVHEYPEAGNYTAVLNVTDGEAFAEANITIVVEGAAAAKEDTWAKWDELGQCHAKDAIEIPGTGIYVHERGDPPGTGYAAGDGTWIYEESNGVEGLQLGGADESDAYVDCVNPDTLIF